MNVFHDVICIDGWILHLIINLVLFFFKGNGTLMERTWCCLLQASLFCHFHCLKPWVSAFPTKKENRIKRKPRAWVKPDRKKLILRFIFTTGYLGYTSGFSLLCMVFFLIVVSKCDFILTVMVSTHENKINTWFLLFRWSIKSSRSPALYPTTSSTWH